MVDYLDVPWSADCTAFTRLARMHHSLSIPYELQVSSADSSIHAPSFESDLLLIGLVINDFTSQGAAPITKRPTIKIVLRDRVAQ